LIGARLAAEVDAAGGGSVFSMRLEGFLLTGGRRAREGR
jgi:hypothetical protein